MRGSASRRGAHDGDLRAGRHYAAERLHDFAAQIPPHTMSNEDKLTAACVGVVLVAALVALGLPLWPLPQHFWPETLVQVSQVLAPFATLSAVCVSLYLALRRPRPSLSLLVGHRLLITPGIEHHRDLVMIEATNVGSVAAVIMNVGWRVGPVDRPQWGIQQLDTEFGIAASKLPTKLEHGETARYPIRTEGHHGWLVNVEAQGFFPEQVKSRGDLETLRLAVWVTVSSKPFLVKPEPGLLDRIWTRQERHLAKTAVVGSPGDARVVIDKT